MVRLLYGGRTSIFIGVVAAVVTTVFAVAGRPAVRLLPGLDRRDPVPGDGRGVGLPGAAARHRAGHRAGRSAASRSAALAVAGDSLWIPILIIGLVYVPYMARPIRGEILALREKEFVEAAVAQGKGSAADHDLRTAAQRGVDDHRVLHAQHRQQHAAGVVAVVPGGRRAATERVVGHDDRRRLPEHLHRTASDDRSRLA